MANFTSCEPGEERDCGLRYEADHSVNRRRGLIAGVMIFFGHLIVTPDYKPLMTGMEPTDAQSLASRLAAKNIPYQLSPDGKTVSVPSDKLDTSRLK